MRLVGAGRRGLVDLVAGGRIASFVVDGHELLADDRRERLPLGVLPDGAVGGPDRATPRSPSTVDATTCRSTSRRTRSTGRRSSGAGRSSARARSRRISGPTGRSRGAPSSASSLSADALTCRLEVHADEPMPASIGWHPWFVRRPEGLAGELELELDAGAMYVSATPTGIATAELRHAPARPVGRLLHRRAPPAAPALAGLPRADDRVRLPGLGGLHGARRTRCASSRRPRRPTRSTGTPAIVEPGRPLVAEMTWRWRSLAG